MPRAKRSPLQRTRRTISAGVTNHPGNSVPLRLAVSFNCSVHVLSADRRNPVQACAPLRNAWTGSAYAALPSRTRQAIARSHNETGSITNAIIAAA